MENKQKKSKPDHIDGYYYDKEKNRYFRLPKTYNKYHPIVNRPSSTDPAKSPKNFVKNVIFQQLTEKDLRLSENLMTCRLRRMRRQSANKLRLLDFKGTTMENNLRCERLIGDAKNSVLYGVWSGDNSSGTVIYRLMYEKSVYANDRTPHTRCQSLVNAYPPQNRVVDLRLCQERPSDSRTSTTLCLVNHYRDISPGLSCSSLSVNRVDNELGRVDHMGEQYQFSSTLFSCAGFSDESLAIGGEKRLHVFSPRQDILEQDNPGEKVQGRVTALIFDSSGKRVYGGTSSGVLCIYDIRRQKIIEQSRLNCPLISDLHATDNETLLIVSCFSNKLFAVDLRMLKKPIYEFEGHVSECYRSPVSVDETTGVLCAPGQDYRLRFWSLSRGSLLHEIDLTDTIAVTPLAMYPKVLHHAYFSQNWSLTKYKYKPMVISAIGGSLFVYR